jgi:hypothetical protein
MALLVCVGVDEEGFREVLAVEVAGSEKGAAYASLLRGLIDRGLSGVRLVTSDDHEGIKAAVSGELPSAEWQRCTVHFERNVLAHVPASSMAEVAQDIKAIFKVRRAKTARALAVEFVELYGKRFPKAVAVFEAGIEDALTYLSPSPEATTPSYARPTCSRASVEGGKEEDEGGGGLPQRDERPHAGNGDSLEEQRGVGAETLSDDGRSPRSGETKPTTFETLTSIIANYR